MILKNLQKKLTTDAKCTRGRMNIVTSYQCLGHSVSDEHIFWQLSTTLY